MSTVSFEPERHDFTTITMRSQEITRRCQGAYSILTSMIRDPGDLVGISEQFKEGYLVKSRDIKRHVIS